MITRRREFLVAGATLGTSGLVGLMPLVCAAEKDRPAEDVSAVEDLMREHGVLRRILLVYEEGLRRLREKRELPSAVLHRAAMLVRKFVEEYHEKLEEEFLFPEFEKRNELVPLVKVLRKQHEAGRRATDIMQRATDTASPTDEQAGKFAVACESFIRMYRPHAAREDTVLFPSLRKLLSAARLDELGDKFEEEEDRRFGADGFGNTVNAVAALEMELGIYELDHFTPKWAQ